MLAMPPVTAFWPRSSQSVIAVSPYQAVVLREASASSLTAMVSQKIVAQIDGGPNRELRDYGVGAQILTDLGVSQMILLSNTRPNVVSLEGYDLEITDWKPLQQES